MVGNRPEGLYVMGVLGHGDYVLMVRGLRFSSLCPRWVSWYVGHCMCFCARSWGQCLRGARGIARKPILAF